MPRVTNTNKVVNIHIFPVYIRRVVKGGGNKAYSPNSSVKTHAE